MVAHMSGVFVIFDRIYTSIVSWMSSCDKIHHHRLLVEGSLRLGTAVAEGSGIASPAQDRLVSGAVNKTFLVGHTKFWVPSTVQGRRQCAGRKCGDKVL